MSTPFEASIRQLIGQLPSLRRTDSWVNVLTGLGSAVTDKVANTVPATFHQGLSAEVLSDLFHSDATVRKAVTKRPHEALRLGVRLNLPKDAGGSDTATKFQDAFDDLEVVGTYLRACTWENLFGGAAIFVAVDDGQYAVDSQAQPINRARLRRVLWLKAIDASRIHPSYDPGDLDQDPNSRTYGQPQIYLIDVHMSGFQLRIHRDRLILFPGALTTDVLQRSRQGWGISIIDPVYEVLQRNVSAWQSAGNSLANAQYVVYKLRGLAHIFSAQDGEEKAKRRARAMEMAKSMINAVLIDADDDYVRENPNFGNMPAMLDQFMLDVASALDMPATVLWGRSPAGMNATGESDLENWYASVDAYREHHLRPRLHQLVELIMASKEGPTAGTVFDGWRVTFPPLRQMSEMQKAEVRAKTSQADASDITAGILLPQEAALSRFRPEGYSIETTIDLALREKLRDIEVEQRERELSEGRGPGMTPAPPPPPEPAPEPVPAQEAAE